MTDSTVGPTPADVASELGVTASAVRRYLRREFSRPGLDSGSRWSLSQDEVRAVRNHFANVDAVDAVGCGDPERWREFAAFARELVDAGRIDLDQLECEFKRGVAERMSIARQAVVDGNDEWPADVDAAIGSGGALLFHIARSRFKELLFGSPEDVRTQLMQLWRGDGSPDSVATFVGFVRDAIPQFGPGNALTLVSILLMGSTDSAPYRAHAVSRALHLVGADPVASSDVLSRWAQFVGMLEQADSALESEGLRGDDLIYAQSMLYVMTEYDADRLGDSSYAFRLRAWRGDSKVYERANRTDPVVEDAAWSILRKGLASESSAVTGGPSVWTANAALDVVSRLAAEPTGDIAPGFYERLKVQFAGASTETVQFLLEIQLVRQLATSNIGLEGARKAVAIANDIAGTEWELTEELQAAFAREGIFGGGAYFNQNQWRHITFAAKAVEEWCALENPERARLQRDPWAWLDFLEGVDGSTPADAHMRVVLSYIAWPNYFHPVVSSDHVAKIRSTYSRFIEEAGGPQNVDIQRDLHAIELGLQKETGIAQVNFYRPPFRDQWFAGELPRPEPRHGESFEAIAQRIAPDLFMHSAELGRIARVLEHRRQVVFYGPPGTGKTFVARELARAIAGADDAVTLVQFHPSYAYEDFFEGFRPGGGGAIGNFALQRGPLRLLAASATDNPDQPHFLVIDEMNRGNLAKVFGELYFLLEYRGESVSLLYSPAERFTLPPNLHIIGTMNTTDRSIGLVDAAIRRRFAFMEFHPDSEPVSGVLDRYLAATSGDSHLAALLTRLNALIDDRDLRIGPSYFMREDARTQQGLEDIWDFDILPLLFEHFYGDRSPATVRRDFSLSALLREPPSEDL